MSDLMMEHLKRVTDLCEEKTARIAALEAQNQNLIVMLTRILSNPSFQDLIESNSKTEYLARDARAVLSEVTQ